MVRLPEKHRPVFPSGETEVFLCESVFIFLKYFEIAGHQKGWEPLAQATIFCVSLNLVISLVCIFISYLFAALLQFDSMSKISVFFWCASVALCFDIHIDCPDEVIWNIEMKDKKIECLARNNDQDHMLWFKNSKILNLDKLSPRVEFDLKVMKQVKIATLYFRSLRENDQGLYKFATSNSTSLTHSVIQVRIDGKSSQEKRKLLKRVERSEFENSNSPAMHPAKPIINKTVANLTSHSADVLFSVPLNGSAPPTQCTANVLAVSHLNAEPLSFQKLVGLKMVSIKHLQPQSTVNITVACSNEYGSSPYSDPFSFITFPDAPSHSPTNINLTELNETTVALRWRAGEDETTHYRINFTPVNSLSFSVNSSCCDEVVIVDKAVSYTVILFACNPSGCGPGSSPKFILRNESHIAATTKPYDINSTHPSTNTSYIIIGILVATCLLLAALGGWGINECRRRRNKELKKRQLEQSNEGRDSRTLRSVNNDYIPMSGQSSITSFDLLRETVGEVLIKKENLFIGKLLGEGEFGYVYKGKLTSSEHIDNKQVITDVAIKCIKSVYRTADETEAFVKEGLRMKDLNHPNVMKLKGICLSNFTHSSETHTNEVSPLVVLPFMPNGDLRNHLFLCRSSGKSNKFNLLKLLHYALDIAKGMEYLVDHGVVHRDLAARNCMLTKDFSVVVSDFGLSRKLYATSYYRQTHITKLPVKWMAIESLGDNIFNSKTDVWSFGITFWEILTLCQTPYPGVANHEIYDHLKSGLRLNKPAYCSQEMWHTLVYPCWNPQANDRITFSELVIRIGKFATKPDENMTCPLSNYVCVNASSTDYEEPVQPSTYNLAEITPFLNGYDGASESSSAIVSL